MSSGCHGLEPSCDIISSQWGLTAANRTTTTSTLVRWTAGGGAHLACPPAGPNVALAWFDSATCTRRRPAMGRTFSIDPLRPSRGTSLHVRGGSRCLPAPSSIVRPESHANRSGATESGNFPLPCARQARGGQTSIPAPALEAPGCPDTTPPRDGFRVRPRVRMDSQSTRQRALKIEQLSVLATVVIAFAALAALVLTGQTGIRQDLRAVQADLLAGQAELRKEMRAGQGELGKEMRAGQAELREEMRAGQAELREEMRAGQAELRNDIRRVHTELRAGQAELREDLESLGVRLAVVEHRADALDTRFTVVERRAVERTADAHSPGDGSDPSASTAGRKRTPQDTSSQ